MEKLAKSVVKEQHERQKFATQVRFWFRQSTKMYYTIFVSCNANRLTFLAALQQENTHQKANKPNFE